MFRAVAVVEVPINHDHFFYRGTVPRQRVSRPDGHVVDETEALADETGLVFVGRLLVLARRAALARVVACVEIKSHAPHAIDVVEVLRHHTQVVDFHTGGGPAAAPRKTRYGTRL